MTFKQATARVEEIRTTSTNIHQVIQSLVDMWKELGVTVVLSDYPSKYNEHASNTHYAPAGYKTNFGSKRELPTGYPAWEGIWDGTIKTEKGELYFSELVNGESFYTHRPKYPKIPWIKTGSGGGGENFRFSGRLFLYDFPLMEKKFRETYDDYYLLKRTYNRVLERYVRDYKAEKNNYVSKQTKLLEIDLLLDEITTLKGRVLLNKKKITSFYYSEFNKNYGKDVPLPATFFDNDTEIKDAVVEASYSTKESLPSLAAGVERLRELTKEIEEYERNSPEVVI
jgi:hypothetical protein